MQPRKRRWQARINAESRKPTKPGETPVKRQKHIMNNVTEKLPSELAETLSDKIALHVTFKEQATLYTYAPALNSEEFCARFPDHKRITAMLSSSGSSWAENAYIFCTADYFDPPVYVQFGSTFEDAYESFLDNEPSLIIPESDYVDYGLAPDGGGSPECQFNSDGQPVDTDNVQGFGPLALVSISFAE